MEEKVLEFSLVMPFDSCIILIGIWSWILQIFMDYLLHVRASLVAQMVKNLPATRETQVWSLSHEDPLEKGMATHSSILAWRIPWTEEPGEVHGVAKSQTLYWVTNTHAAYSVQFSHSVMFDSLQPHGLQHTRLPCPPQLQHYSQ